MLHCKDFEGFNFAEKMIKLSINKTKLDWFVSYDPHSYSLDFDLNIIISRY